MDRLPFAPYFYAPRGLGYRAFCYVRQESPPALRYCGFDYQANVFDLTAPFAERLSTYRRYKPTRKAKYVVFTVITGGYERLINHSYFDSDCDYVCFIDQTIDTRLFPAETFWETRVFSAPEGLNAAQASRYPKINAHLFLPEHSHSLYLDANIDILTPLLYQDTDRALNEETLLAFSRHSQNCAYTQAQTIIDYQHDTPEAVGQLVQFLRKAGMPEQWGLSENNFIFRNHRHPKVIQLMEEWWALYAAGTKRDQLSLPYVLWKNNFPLVFLNPHSYRYLPRHMSVPFTHGIPRPYAERLKKLKPASPSPLFKMPSTPASTTVTADTPAVVVPSGEAIVIPAGSVVQITHRLGGNLTVTWEYGMARVAGKYAANLGEEAPRDGGTSGEGAQQSWKPGEPPPEKAAWEALRLVFDPEIPVNIVDLGLIYSLDLEPLATVKKADAAPSAPEAQLGLKPEDIEGFKAWVKMTLTAPGCGMGPAIAADAKERLLQVGGILDAQVDIVWDPPWNQAMISVEGKMQLGLI